MAIKYFKETANTLSNSQLSITLKKACKIVIKKLNLKLSVNDLLEHFKNENCLDWLEDYAIGLIKE